MDEVKHALGDRDLRRGDHEWPDAGWMVGAGCASLDWSSLPGTGKEIDVYVLEHGGAEIRSYLQANNIPSLVKPFEVVDLISQARRLLQKTQAAVAK